MAHFLVNGQRSVNWKRERERERERRERESERRERERAREREKIIQMLPAFRERRAKSK